MFTLLAAAALLCLGVTVFLLRPHLVVPWAIVAIVDWIAWRLGYQTYVRAQGGSGCRLGRFGAEAIYFLRRDPAAKRVPPLNARRAPSSFMMLLAPLAMIALAGCTTTTPTGDDTIAKAQAAAKTACSFLPTAETVADIIKANDPTLSTAKAIANAICNALNPETPAGIMTLFKAAPTVDGVVIRGQRVGG